MYEWINKKIREPCHHHFISTFALLWGSTVHLFICMPFSTCNPSYLYILSAYTDIFFYLYVLFLTCNPSYLYILLLSVHIYIILFVCPFPVIIHITIFFLPVQLSFYLYIFSPSYAFFVAFCKVFHTFTLFVYIVNNCFNTVEKSHHLVFYCLLQFSHTSKSLLKQPHAKSVTADWDT